MVRDRGPEIWEENKEENRACPGGGGVSVRSAWKWRVRRLRGSGTAEHREEMRGNFKECSTEQLYLKMPFDYWLAFVTLPGDGSYIYWGEICKCLLDT